MRLQQLSLISPPLVAIKLLGTVKVKLPLLAKVTLPSRVAVSPSTLRLLGALDVPTTMALPDVIAPLFIFMPPAVTPGVAAATVILFPPIVLPTAMVLPTVVLAANINTLSVALLPTLAEITLNILLLPSIVPEPEVPPAKATKVTFPVSLTEKPEVEKLTPLAMFIDPPPDEAPLIFIVKPLLLKAAPANKLISPPLEIMLPPGF